MTIRKLMLSLALVGLLLPSLSLATQERRLNATVLLRNGDRVTGLLEDVGNGTVWVRVNLGDQRRIPLSEIALIDFVGGAQGLPETELRAARGSNHVVVLRNGTSLTGQFIDISGGEENARPDEKYALMFRTTSGEERRSNLDEVGRIYLGNFPGATTQPVTPSEPVPAGAVRVPGNARWVATPLVVRSGDQVRFNVDGRVQLSDDAEDVAISAGSLRQRRADGAPIPSAFAGALIARVGNSPPFPIGNVTTPVTMPANGQLYLGINDDEVADNRGEFVVNLQHLPRRR
ncbi:MAG: hypothetical protein ACRD2A_18755 [Vicinamibacterales bacterium]